MSLWLISIGSAVVVVWGIAHIIPTRTVVAGFGELTADNRRIITMEWVAEGLALIFIGVLALEDAIVARSPSSKGVGSLQKRRDRACPTGSAFPSTRGRQTSKCREG